MKLVERSTVLPLDLVVLINSFLYERLKLSTRQSLCGLRIKRLVQDRKRLTVNERGISYLTTTMWGTVLTSNYYCSVVLELEKEWLVMSMKRK
jgi:hypothetical protein